jgi:hypothetical protein
MKKKSRTSPGSVHSKSMVAAAVIALPLAGLPSALVAQDRTTITTTEIGTIQPLQLELMVKLSEKDLVQATIMGLLGGRPVYTNTRGEYFYLESVTGDFHYLTKTEIATFTRSGLILNKDRISTVTILGLDARGYVIQRNSLGQTFYLNSRTGDMVFVK